MSTLHTHIIFFYHLPNYNYVVICVIILFLLLDYVLQKEKVDVFLFSLLLGPWAQGNACHTD